MTKPNIPNYTDDDIDRLSRARVNVITSLLNGGGESTIGDLERLVIDLALMTGAYREYLDTVRARTALAEVKP